VCPYGGRCVPTLGQSHATMCCFHVSRSPLGLLPPHTHSRRRLSSGGDDLALDDDFRFRIEASKLCLFVAGPPSYDTLISMHSQVRRRISAGLPRADSMLWLSLGSCLFAKCVCSGA
jgi:hypothetical protein